MKNKFDQLAQIISDFSKIYATYAQKSGLSYNELHFIYYLAKNEHVTPTDISQRWSIPKQTINSICHKFSASGLIKIQPDVSDKRKKVILLTDYGIKFAKPLIEKINQAELQIQSQINPKEFDSFLNEFTQITKDLKNKLS